MLMDRYPPAVPPSPSPGPAAARLELKKTAGGALRWQLPAVILKVQGETTGSGMALSSWGNSRVWWHHGGP